MRTKRVINSLRKEKAKLVQEAEQIGRAISVLEGRPRKKSFKHSKRSIARISAAKRLWWQRRRSLLKSAQSQKQVP